MNDGDLQSMERLGAAIAEVRRLVNLPANELDPQALAAAVLFSLERARSPSSDMRSLLVAITDVVKIDPFTIHIKSNGTTLLLPVLTWRRHGANEFGIGV